MSYGCQQLWVLGVWAAALGASLHPVATQGVILNEVMPADASVLADEDGDYPGWAELYNPGPETVNLGGYGLSDDPTQLYKWVFPSIELAPGGYLVVFTSGKNRRLLSGHEYLSPGIPPGSPPHTLPGLLLWLDAADSATLTLVGGRVASWGDKSGRLTGLGATQPIRPDRVAGLKLWLDATDLNRVSITAGRVQVWMDKSGNTNHAWQAEANCQPLHVPDLANGLPMLRFDGANDYLRLPRITGVRTVFWVAAENPTASDDYRPVLGDATTFDFHRGYRYAIYWDNPTVPIARAGTRVWLNGLEIDPFGTPLPKQIALVSTTLTTNLQFGIIGADRLLTNRFWHGEVGEIIVFDRELPSAERRGVEEYLIRKWQLTRPPVADKFDAVQADPEQRPEYRNDLLSGLPKVCFDGLNDNLAFPRINEIRTLFWVGAEPREAAQGYGPVLGDTIHYDFHRGDARLIYSWQYVPKAVASGRSWLNGELIDPLATRLPCARTLLVTITTNDCRASLLGADRLSAGAFLNGEVAEVILYDRPLPDAERQAVERYLAQKWLLPVHYLHTSFNLNAGGQWLLLTAHDGRVVSQVPLAVFRSDISLGRSLGTDQAWAYFACPTPGRANTTPAAAGVVPEPVLTPAGGFFTNTISVEATASAPEVALYYTLDGSEPEEPLARPVDLIWVDDAPPTGAALGTAGRDVWQWISSSPAPYSGKLAHQSALITGFHQHSFTLAQTPMLVRTGDSLITYVYLDPLFTPLEVMLQWYADNWEHRAYWGADNINLGTPGTPGRVCMGPLPPVGQWVRLEVPASRVALEEKAVTGMAFALQDGRVTWDCSGKATTRPGSSVLYTAPLALAADTVLRMRAFRPGWAPSRIVTASYFANPASTLPIVSLVTSPDNLFSEERGIFAMGPAASPVQPHYGANFWKDWERPVHVEFYEADGRRGFSLDAGVRVHGGWTRCYPQKSMRLYARRRYGDSAIRYRVFPNLPIDRFENLVLRNSGNDWAKAMMRDVLVQGLADELDLDRQANRPARAYINGQYWGIYQVQERVDEHYLAAHHQVDPEAVDIVEAEAIARAGSSQSYDALLATVATRDLADPENYCQVAQEMDAANYTDYQITEIYADNTDWPGNNVQCWRAHAPGAKWRWILYDMDGCFDITETGADANRLAVATSSANPWPSAQRSALLLRNLLRNGQFRERFISRFADLLNTTFAPERVLQRIAQTQAELAPEVPLHIARWAGKYAGFDVFTNMPAWNAHVDVLRAFATQRPQYVRQHLADYFGLAGTAQLTICATNAAAGQILVNSLTLAGTNLPWTGTYFRGVPVSVTAVPKPTCVFAGWAGTDLTNASLNVILTNDLTLRAVFMTEEEYNYPNLRPKPFDLLADDYRFDSFAPDTPARTYPPSMVFLQTATRDPGLAAELESEWTLPYNLTSRSRIRGLGAYGLSFINTGETQGGAAGYLGAALLALRTVGVADIQVTWTGGTVSPNSRLYAIRLQYRVGTQGPFMDVLDQTGLPVEYVRSDIVGDSQRLGPVTLPAEVNNRPVVQLRWKYYFIPTGASGARAELRLDDILVSPFRPVPVLAGFSRLGDNAIRGEFMCLPGQGATLMASTNLMDWLPVQRVLFDGAGKASLELPIQLETPACFYRLRLP